MYVVTSERRAKGGLKRSSSEIINQIGIIFGWKFFKQILLFPPSLCAEKIFKLFKSKFLRKGLNA